MRRVRHLIASCLTLALVVAMTMTGVAYADSDNARGNSQNRGKPAFADESGLPDRNQSAKADKESPRNDDAAADKGRNAHLREPGVRSDAEGAQDSADTSSSVVPSATVEPKLTGIANALGHIQENLARIEARVQASGHGTMPSGLQRVALRFMSWLGLGASAGEGSSEPTHTVEPTGTIEPTGTVEPTGTIEPTGTVQPALLFR